MDPQSLDHIYRKKRAIPLPVAAAALAGVLVAVLAVRSCRREAAEAEAETVQAGRAVPASRTTPAETPVATETAVPATRTTPAGTPVAAEAAVPVPATDAPRVGTLTEDGFKQAVAAAEAAEKTGKLYDARDVLLAALDQAGDDFAPALEQMLGRLSTVIYFTPRPGPDKIVYAVKEGDSLARLADRHVCPVALIMRANGVKDAKRIQPGQTLVFPDHPKFAVTVSKSKNTLLLTLDGKFFKRYVVGTGANAKTPAGTYKMVDREEHPDWWKDGERIPYGDPRNILGTHWLALEPTGDTPRVSGYGIHGTWDNSTLGKQSSAGCVRMRNEDVEELFVLLPRGTPVLIVE